MLYEYVNARRGKNTWYLYYNPDQNDINVMVPFEAGVMRAFEIVE